MKKVILLILIPVIYMMTGCIKDIEDYNVDTKKPSVVEAEPLVANAMKGMNDWMNSVNVNTNVFRFYVQHITATQYLDEPRYDMVTRTIPQALWNGMYVSTLADLKEAKRIITANTILSANDKANQLAMIDLLQVYAYSILVNTFGDIPYTEALDVENLQPKFDDAKTIYKDLLTRVTTSTAALNTSAAGFGSSDLIYGGNVTKWVKFGNSLRLKLAMVMADEDAALATSNVKAAAADASKLIVANADNALFKYLSSKPNNNPLSNDVPPLSSRKDFVAANTLVDYMKGLNDGRLGSFFSKNGSGEFAGGVYGFVNAYDKFSTFSSKVIATTFAGNMLDAAEVNFLLAEAVERGMLSGSAEQYYNNAITASYEYWGATDVATYLAQPSVSYATATGTWKAKIGNQKWIALYNRPYDAWTSWRHLDAPTLTPPSAPNVGAIPVRLIYPIVENSLNKASIEAAATKIGGDKSSTKLWWDKN